MVFSIKTLHLIIKGKLLKIEKELSKSTIIPLIVKYSQNIMATFNEKALMEFDETEVDADCSEQPQANSLKQTLAF